MKAIELYTSPNSTGEVVNPEKDPLGLQPFYINYLAARAAPSG